MANTLTGRSTWDGLSLCYAPYLRRAAGDQVATLCEWNAGRSLEVVPGEIVVYAGISSWIIADYLPGDCGLTITGTNRERAESQPLENVL